MIKCIIVEDDSHHASDLAYLLKETNRQIEVLSMCPTVDDALLAIDQFHPELIFLDIKLEGGETGFDLLQKVDFPEFDIIFTTMHDSAHNMLAAIRVCALDFLIKPIDLADLENALKRFLEKKKTGLEQVRALKANLELSNSEDRSICISEVGSDTIIQIKNILYCQSDNVVTHFFLESLVDGKDTYTSSRGIGQWEKDLENSSMCQIHYQYIVNLNKVIKYLKKDGDMVRVVTGKELPVSRSRKKIVRKRLGLS